VPMEAQTPPSRRILKDRETSRVRKVSPTVVGSRMSFLMDRIKALDVPNDDGEDEKEMPVKRSRRSSDARSRPRDRGEEQPVVRASLNQHMAEEQSQEDQHLGTEIPERSRESYMDAVGSTGTATSHTSDQSHVSLSSARTNVSASSVDFTRRTTREPGLDFGSSNSRSNSSSTGRNTYGDESDGPPRAQSKAAPAQNELTPELSTEDVGGDETYDHLGAASDTGRTSASEEFGETSLEDIEATVHHPRDSNGHASDNNAGIISSVSSRSSIMSTTTSSAMLAKMKSMMGAKRYPSNASFFRKRPSMTSKTDYAAVSGDNSDTANASTEQQAGRTPLHQSGTREDALTTADGSPLPSATTSTTIPATSLAETSEESSAAAPSVVCAQNSGSSNLSSFGPPLSHPLLNRVQQPSSSPHRGRAASSPAVVQHFFNDDRILSAVNADTGVGGTTSSVSTSSALRVESLREDTSVPVSAAAAATTTAAETSTAAAVRAAADADFDDSDDDSDDSDGSDDSGNKNLPASPAITPENSPSTPLPPRAQVRSLVDAAEEILLRSSGRSSPGHHDEEEEVQREAEDCQRCDQHLSSRTKPPMPDLSPWEFAKLGMKFVAVAILCARFVMQDMSRALGLFAARRTYGAAATVGTAATVASGELRALVAQWRAYSWLAMQLGGVAVACFWFLVQDSFSWSLSWALSAAMSLFWPRKIIFWGWPSPAADTTEGNPNNVAHVDGTTAHSAAAAAAAANDAVMCSPTFAGCLDGVVAAAASGGRGGFFQRRLGRPLRGRPEVKEDRRRGRVSVTAAPCPEQ